MTPFNFPECRKGWKNTETGEEIPDGEGRTLKLELVPRLIITGGWFNDTEVPIKPPEGLTAKQKVNWLKHYGQYLLDEPEILQDIIMLSAGYDNWADRNMPKDVSVPEVVS